MTDYNTQENKTALTEAVKNYAYDLEGMFVADNLRVLAMYEWEAKQLAKHNGAEYNGTDYGFLATCVASEMEAVNGGHWQYDTDEVIAFVDAE